MGLVWVWSFLYVVAFFVRRSSLLSTKKSLAVFLSFFLVTCKSYSLILSFLLSYAIFLISKSGIKSLLFNNFIFLYSLHRDDVFIYVGCVCVCVAMTLEK